MPSCQRSRTVEKKIKIIQPKVKPKSEPTITSKRVSVIKFHSSASVKSPLPLQRVQPQCLQPFQKQRRPAQLSFRHFQRQRPRVRPQRQNSQLVPQNFQLLQPQNSQLQLQSFQPKSQNFQPLHQHVQLQPQLIEELISNELDFAIPLEQLTPKPEPGSMIEGLWNSLEGPRPFDTLNLRRNILWNIMKRLSFEEKKVASLVCKNWAKVARCNFTFKRSTMILDNNSFRFLGTTEIINRGLLISRLTDTANFSKHFTYRPFIHVFYFKNPIIENRIMYELMKACPNIQYIRVEVAVNPKSRTLSDDEIRARMFLTNDLFWTLPLCKNLRTLEIFCGWSPSGQDWEFDCASLTCCVNLSVLNFRSFGSFKIYTFEDLPPSLVKLDMTMFSAVPFRQGEKMLAKALHARYPPPSPSPPSKKLTGLEFRRIYGEDIAKRFPKLTWYHFHPRSVEQAKILIDSLPEFIHALQLTPEMRESVRYHCRHTFGQFDYKHEFQNLRYSRQYD